MSDLIEVLSLAAALVAAVAALWHKLRAERYRSRWTEARSALKDDDDDASESGGWEVLLTKNADKSVWIVTDGKQVAVELNADFGYGPAHTARARREADDLARDLNAGKIKVAA